jgi:hypothetical protein
MARYRDDHDDDDRPRRRPARRRDDDEDDEVARPGLTNTQVVVLALAGVCVSALLVCGGGAIYVYRSMVKGVDEVRQQAAVSAEKARELAEEAAERHEQEQARQKREAEASDKGQATKAMEQFIADLKADRVEPAYDQTTADFQKRVPLAEFQKLAAVVGSKDAQHLHMQADFNAPASGSTYVFDNLGGFVTVKVTVVKDLGGWKVDRFTATKSRTGPGGFADENSDKGKATKAMEALMAELKADRVEAAYKLTTADFQKRTPLGEFRKLVGPVAANDSRHLMMRADFFAPADGPTFTFDGSGGWGMTVKVTMVKDGEGWLCDRLAVTKGNRPGSPDDDSDKAKATRFAETFLTEVKAGRAEAAYKLTTADFQKQNSQTDFKKLVAVLASPKNFYGFLRGDFQAPAEGTTYAFTVSVGAGNTLKLTAVSEGGKWLIDRVIVSPAGR